MWPYPWTHVGTPSHLGHMDRVAATMPSQAHAGAAQEAPDIGQWEGQDVPLVRPSSCNVKGGIPSSRRYLPTYLKQGLRNHFAARGGRLFGWRWCWKTWRLGGLSTALGCCTCSKWAVPHTLVELLKALSHRTWLGRGGDGWTGLQRR